jgi:membrane-associated protease RseP (regulator of RpoE activity)
VKEDSLRDTIVVCVVLENKSVKRVSKLVETEIRFCFHQLLIFLFYLLIFILCFIYFMYLVL